MLIRLCSVLGLIATALGAAEVTTQRLNNAAKEPQNWLTYSGTYNAWRYSPLDQINKANVAKLKPAWVFQTGKIEGGFSATPLVSDGVMYITSPSNRVFAIDAVTGKELWHYYYAIPKEFGLIYGPWNRGVAIGSGQVFMGTIDNHVVALDAKTGKETWNVTVESMKECGCNITGAPIVVNNKVVVGVTGGDSAHRGYINAFDAKTGRRAWRFWTIPGPGEPGNETWKGDSWKSGGGSTWLTGSFDPELNLIYWGVGNPAADFYGDSREGANLYTDSIVALDADTGKLKWYNQLIPHDVWDWDAGYEIVLLDLPVNGKTEKLLVSPNKGGYTWVLDRVTGKFVNAWPLAKNINWITGIDKEGKLVGRQEPQIGKPILVCPSIGGGRSWNHGAYSPKTGLFYTTGIEWCQQLTVQKEEPKTGNTFFGGNFELRKPPVGKEGGHLDARDPLTGKIKWTYESKYPLLASALTTSGDLLFTGDPEGNFLAFDATSGKKLWSYQTGSGHRGSPIAYSVNGKQYIAVPVGWGSALAGLMTQLWPEAEDFPGGSALFVFALPE